MIVRPTLFTITCTTCQVRLAVRSAEAVGAILECPKCGCMVPVIPPEGWQPPKPAIIPAVQSTPQGESTSQEISQPTGNPPVLDSEDSAASESTAGASARLWHSWYAIAAASIVAVAIGVVVWMTFFSRSELDNSASSHVERPKARSADSPAVADQKDLNPQASEQSASTGDNETPIAASTNTNDKSDTKPAAEKSTEAKPQSGPETTETKTAET
jgi:hypothetical protein